MEKEINIDDEELKDKPASEEENPVSDEEQEEAENVAETAEERDPLDVALEEIESLKDKYLRQVAEFSLEIIFLLQKLLIIHKGLTLGFHQPCSHKLHES